MNQICHGLLFGLFLFSLAGSVSAKSLELQASKDTFGRSNERNRNNGGNAVLAVSSASNIRTIIAFDLGGVTNEIIGAELRFRQHNTVEKPISLVVVPMAHTTNNAAWGEGAGNVGMKGRLAAAGDACYSYSAFNATAWESPKGVPVADLGDGLLWGAPIATLNPLPWEEGRMVNIAVDHAALLEEARKSATPVFTFGMWGTSGNGIYLISSRSSSWPPVLVLSLKEDGTK